MWRDLFDKTFALAKFNFRKDKKYISIWLISLISLLIILSFYYIGRATTQTEWDIMAETLKSPAMTLIVGTAPDVTPSAATMFALEMTLFTTIIVAIMNIFLVTRNTREDEEDGRLEIIRSLSIGRLSNLAASLLQAFITNLILAVGVGLSLGFLNFGIGSMNSGILFGFILGASGFMFAMITAIFAQVFQSNRTVIMSSFAFLGFSFIFRGITDISAPVFSWLSPLAWSYKTEVYANNYWFPILLMLILSIFALLISLYLNHIRDLDSSFIKQKRGKIHASKLLVKPFGLVTRLNKATLIGWIVGIFVLGATIGSIVSDLENFFASNEILQSMFPHGSSHLFVHQFIAMISCIVGVVIAIPSTTFIGRVYSEEKKNHMENIVSKAITRNKLLGTYLKFSLITSVILTLISVISVYVVGYETLNFVDVLKASMVFIPAIWFVIGLAVFLIGLFPKLFGLIWVILGYSFFITYFGEMLKLPMWLKILSPFYHIPLIPVEEFNALPLIMLLVLGIMFTITGFKTYKERDITS